MAAEVCLADQEKINEFSRLNLQLTSLYSRLDQLEDKKESIEDALSELELTDETQIIPYLLGNCYVDISCSRVIEMLHEQEELLTQQITVLNSGKLEIETKMSHLKSTLYAKFGTTINLERD